MAETARLLLPPTLYAPPSVKCLCEDFDGAQSALVPLLGKSPDWVAEATPAKRFGRKARFAFEHSQFVKAIALPWQAILVAGCRRYNTGDLMYHRVREPAEERPYADSDAGGRDALSNVQHLRKAILHGTAGVRQDIRQTLNSAQTLRAAFEAGARF